MLRRPIPNYLPHAILTTLLCCMPLGLVGLYYSLKVNALMKADDLIGAREASAKAKFWCALSGGIGFFVLLIYGLSKAFGAVAMGA